MKSIRVGLRAFIRGHRSFVVEGIRYRERSTERLHRALSGYGSGSKEYDLLFPDASPLRIRCTPNRQYADVVGPRVVHPYTLADPIIRPGMRVLDARCSTGFGARHLAERVGPSGGVVALDPDHESIRYARRRYAPGNTSFEIGDIASIGGELDGAFDAVVAVNLIHDAHDGPALAAALWRVLAPGGPMLLVQPLPTGTKDSPDGPLRLISAELRNMLHDLHPPPGIEPAETNDLAAVIARKPAGPPPDAGQPYPPGR